MRIPLNQLKKLIREELHTSHRQQFLEQRGRRDRRERRADEEALEDLAAEEGERAATRAAAEQGLAGVESREAERDVEVVEAGRWPESTKRQWQGVFRAMLTSDDQDYVERMTTAIQDQSAPTHDDDINWWNNFIGQLNAPEEEGGLALNLPEVRDEDVSFETEVSAETQVARAEVPAGGLSLGTDGWTPSGYHYYVTDDVIRFVHPTSGKVVTVSEESNKKAWDAILGNIDGANEAYMAAVAARDSETILNKYATLLQQNPIEIIPGKAPGGGPGEVAMVMGDIPLRSRGRPPEEKWVADFWTVDVPGMDTTTGWVGPDTGWQNPENTTSSINIQAGGRGAIAQSTMVGGRLKQSMLTGDEIGPLSRHVPEAAKWFVEIPPADLTALYNAKNAVVTTAADDADTDLDPDPDADADALKEAHRQGKLIAERWQRLAGMKVL